MTDEAIVNTAVLEADAEKLWEAASATMRSAGQKVPAVPVSAFGFVPGMEKAGSLYEKSRQALKKYCEGGGTEFHHFEALLLRTIIVYKQSHGASQAEIDRLTGMIDV